MDTRSLEHFEAVCGKVVTKMVHKLVNMTGSEDFAETNVKLTMIYQRMCQQLGSIEEMIVEKSHEEAGANRGKTRKMLHETRIEAEARGKAWMKERYKKVQENGDHAGLVGPDGEPISSEDMQ